MGKTVFSFCVYGSAPKYCRGMTVNIGDIEHLFPEAEIWITTGHDVPESYIAEWKEHPAVRILPMSITGGELMTYRFFCYDEPEVDVLLVRDSDSRLTDRDVACIQEFLSSPYTQFTVRDHYYHNRKIMGGQWGLKKTRRPPLRECYDDFKRTYNRIGQYYSDEDFLDAYVYDPPNMLAFTSLYEFPGETVREIPGKRRNDYDFCGNAYTFEGSIPYPEFSTHGTVTLSDYLRFLQTHPNNPR